MANDELLHEVGYLISCVVDHDLSLDVWMVRWWRVMDEVEVRYLKRAASQQCTCEECMDIRERAWVILTTEEEIP
jgi:hypothetical protein